MKEKVECAQRLREALGLRDMKQVDLCEKTGIGKSAMSQYVNGTVEPKQDRVELIAKALNVTEAWLMGYDVPMEHCVIDPGEGWAGCSYFEQFEYEGGRKYLDEQLANEKELAEKDGELLKALNDRPILRQFVENLIHMDDESVMAFATIAGIKSHSEDK
ncbi:MAG: helix-turn-helix domain-containing protein [Ruminococcaceae bacterium]|nr:helix-turn-helix domain-containing protein [Oscillospiraceae bacterium]